MKSRFHLCWLIVLDQQKYRAICLFALLFLPLALLIKGLLAALRAFMNEVREELGRGAANGLTLAATRLFRLWPKPWK